MLYCNYCDYLVRLRNSDGTKFCRNLICVYSNYTFSDEALDELLEHPCHFARQSLLKSDTD